MTTTSPPFATSGLRYRLDRVRLPDAADGQELAAHRRAALASPLALAHALGSAVVVATVRAAAGGRVGVLLDLPGALIGVPDDSGDTMLEFPSGSRGRSLATPGLPKFAATFDWVELPMQVFPVVGDEAPTLGQLVEDRLSSTNAACAFVVAATPVAPDRVAERLRAVESQLPGLQQQSALAGANARLARLTAEYEMLDEASLFGGWAVRVFVGADTHRTALGIAAIIGSATDLVGRPVRLGRPIPTPPAGAAPPDSPIIVTDTLALLLHPPTRELPGLRAVAPAAFDLVPERPGDISLGSVLDEHDRFVGPFTVSTDTLNRHAFVTGATGAGKSQTVRRLLTSLTERSIPWLVVEPAKSEYAAIAGRLANTEITVIRPGSLDAPPAGMNPLEPSSVTIAGVLHTFPLQTHLDLVRALFTAAFDADEPFPQVLSQALLKSYESLGWDIVLGEQRSGNRPRYPTLGDLQTNALEVVDNIGYGKEITDNVRGFVNVRLGSLRLGTTGGFFETSHPIDLDLLLQRPTVFEIEDVGNDADKAFLIGVVIIRLVERLRLLQQFGTPAPGLRHVLVLEEAHRLLRNAEPGSAAAQAVELFAGMLAEVRAYGQGIVVAEQIPSKIAPDVVKNSALKIVHRLPSTDDREFVGGTMNLSDEQSQAVVSFLPGIAATHADGMDRPIRIAVDATGAERERRATVLPAPPVGRATAACGAFCQAEPCTLRQIRTAQLMADDDTELSLWVELTVIGHIIGRSLPQLRAEWIAALRARHTDGERLQCAVAHLAQAGADRRGQALAAHFPPDDFVQHVYSSLIGQLRGQAPCAAEVDWQAAEYRYLDVLAALLLHQDSGATDAHPETATYRARGVPLPQLPVAAQIDAIRAEHQRLGGPGGRLLGSPAAIDQLLAARVGTSGRAAALGAVTAPFWDAVPGWLTVALAPEEVGNQHGV